MDSPIIAGWDNFFPLVGNLFAFEALLEVLYCGYEAMPTRCSAAADVPAPIWI